MRRARSRAQRKLDRDVERLALLERGGAPDRPIPVESASQVDVIAERTRCPRCALPLRLEQHAASTVGGVRLRVAETICTACGKKRNLYFKIDSALLH